MTTPDQHAVETTSSATSRRTIVTGAAAGLAATAIVAQAGPAEAAGNASGQVTLTVLGTTDLHGNVYNWDYFKNAEFDDAAHNDIGVAKAKTLIDQERAAARGPVLVLDAGDTIQGTPLSFYYAKVDPITETKMHPMANAMNLIGYDAAALGNHEFNYGIPLLRTFENQLNFPLLGANAVDPVTKRPVFTPYIVKEVATGLGTKPIKVGILGLTNPGIAIWDKANVEGRMEFPGLVEQATRYVPELKAQGCDVVIVSAHSGADTSSSYGDALPYPENASTLVAQQVPDIDIILVGHAHVDIPMREVVNQQTGKTVVLCEPFFWAKRVARFQLQLRRSGTGWRVVGKTSTTLNTNTVAADPAVAAAVQQQHDTVVAYVNSPVGTSVAAMSAARAVVEDVPIIDFVNFVQADAVKAGLTGADTALPVLSIAAPFNRSASFPAGQVSIRDVAGLYIYDNTLLGVKVTGAQVADYLEYSMRYFKQISGPGPFAIADVTNAVTATAPAPNGTPDYNFDSVAGLDAPLTYDIDIAQPVGSRIKNLAYGGVPVAPDKEFAMAVNNYRQSGGGGFPHVATAPVVYNRQIDIRQLLIDWVTAHGTIDPAGFASVDWRLVSNGSPITIT